MDTKTTCDTCTPVFLCAKHDYKWKDTLKPTHTPTPWTAEPFLTPDKDDDPMGVYRFEPIATQLQQEYDAITYPDPDTEEALELEQEQYAAVHAKNEKALAHIVRCVNERDGLLATLDILCDVLERPVNRMGKPQVVGAVSARVRELAIKFDIDGCETLAEQAAKVGRVILSLARAREEQL